MGENVLSLSLLEFLAYRAGHVILSDLHHMDALDRARMARALEVIPRRPPDCGNGTTRWSIWHGFLQRKPPRPPAGG